MVKMRKVVFFDFVFFFFLIYLLLLFKDMHSRHALTSLEGSMGQQTSIMQRQLIVLPHPH